MPFDPTGAVTFNVDYTGKAVNTLTAPKEGPRSIHFHLSPGKKQITIPEWNGSYGLSQICTIFVDARQDVTPYTGQSLLSFFFPDTGLYYDLPLGFSGVVPVITGGNTFVVNNIVQTGTGFCSIGVQNFFLPPTGTVINSNLVSSNDQVFGLTSITAAQRFSVDIGSFGGSTTFASPTGIRGGRLSIDHGSIGGDTTQIAGGLLPVDIKAVSGFPATQNVNLATMSIGLNTMVVAAAGVSTVRLVTGSGILRYAEVNSDGIANGAVASRAVLGISIDGSVNPIPYRVLYFNAGEVVLRSEFVNMTDIAFPFTTSLDLYINVFVGAIVAANTNLAALVGYT